MFCYLEGLNKRYNYVATWGYYNHELPSSWYPVALVFMTFMWTIKKGKSSDINAFVLSYSRVINKCKPNYLQEHWMFGRDNWTCRIVIPGGGITFNSVFCRRGSIDSVYCTFVNLNGLCFVTYKWEFDSWDLDKWGSVLN